MTDRAALLAAIKAHPRELTPRLMYADWLDEFGTTDLDRATSEFIRVSCPRASKLMPPEAFAWIAGNWTRLVPSLMAAATGDRENVWHREGRVIFVRYCGRPDMGWDSPTPKRHRPLGLSFHRGFLEQVVVFSWYAAKFARPLIAADQPLCGRFHPAHTPLEVA